MKNFTDAKGRAWNININVASVKRVLSLVQIDLQKYSDPALIQRLMDEPVVIVDVIFALCKPEADAAKITDEDFGQAMYGDAIDRATEAFLAEWSDFFQKGQRTLIKASLAKFQELRDSEIAKGLTEIQNLTSDSAAKMDGSGSATNSPDTAELTPDHIRLVN